MANVAKIISSDPKISTKEHGLSDVGKKQVAKSASNFLKTNASEDEFGYGSVAIYSSDFTRARETAEIFARELKKANVPLVFDDGNGNGNSTFIYHINITITLQWHNIKQNHNNYITIT